MRKVIKYSNTVSTGISWAENIPSHWNVYRLRHLFLIVKRIVGELGYDVLSITQKGIKVKDITSGDGQLAADYSKYQLAEIGDFAMNHMDLLTGFVDISKYHGVISPDYRVFKLTHSDSDSKFMLYVMQLCYTQKIFFGHGQGVSMLGRWRLPAGRFKDFKIPVPPKEEQIQIASYLDFKLRKINRFIRKKKQLIKLLNEQKAVIINQAVTKGIDTNAKMKDSGIEWLGEIPEHWFLKPIKYIISCNDEALPNQTDKDLLLRYLDIGNVNKEGDISEIVEYKFKDAPSRARRIVKYGDVIISTVRTYLKTITRIKEDIADVIVSTGFAVLRPKKEISSEFLNFSIRANYFIEKVCSESYGVSYPAINATDLVCFKMAYPLIEEQTKIVDFLNSEIDKINTTISNIEKEISLTEEYRTALIAEAVTGKIDVRECIVPLEQTETEQYEELEEEMDIAAEDAEIYDNLEEN